MSPCQPPGPERGTGLRAQRLDCPGWSARSEDVEHATGFGALLGKGGGPGASFLQAKGQVVAPGRAGWLRLVSSPGHAGWHPRQHQRQHPGPQPRLGSRPSSPPHPGSLSQPTSQMERSRPRRDLTQVTWQWVEGQTRPLWTLKGMWNSLEPKHQQATPREGTTACFVLYRRAG